MALLVEDGTGVAGANSFVSLAGADSFWADRGGTSWAAASAGARSAALIAATAWVDRRYLWIGRPYSTAADRLSWPRTDAWDADGRSFAGIVPAPLKDAVCLLAAEHLASSLYAPVEAAATKRIKVGPIEEEYAEGGPQGRRFDVAEQLLAPLHRGRAGSSSRMVRG